MQIKRLVQKWQVVIFVFFFQIFEKWSKTTDEEKTMKSCAIVLVFLSFIFQQIRRIQAGNGELFAEKGQKNYEDEEEGKIIPHR